MKLYKRDSKDKMRVLTIEAVGGEVHQTSGLLEGKKTTRVSQCKAKNIGKANETTVVTQAIAEAESKLTKKLREGYFKTVEEALNNKIMLPMLAKVADLSTLIYPVFLQPKLDGMRMLANGTSKVSRKNKEIETMGHIDLKKLGTIMLDGELYAHGLSFQENMKLIKKVTPNTKDIKYHVYDMPSATGNFTERFAQLLDTASKLEHVEIVPTTLIDDEEELLKYHAMYISQGFEGTIIRLNNAEYEFNKRSDQLLKLKDFIDEAYEIFDVLPSDKDDSIGVVHCITEDGRVFGTGAKFSVEERKAFLINKKDLIGKTAEVRFFEYTDDGLPRFPVYYGIRLDK